MDGTAESGVVDLAAISSALTCRADGIWYAPGAAAVSYPEAGNENCFAIEEQSFWFAHRNRCIAALLAQFPPPSGGPLFDIGGGNGFVAGGIAACGIPVVLVEPGVAGARNARARGLPNVVCGSLETAGFSQETLPAVGLFDVIEHVPEDVEFLRRVRRHLVRGGRVYLTVPAYPALWSDEDASAGHFRRYTRRTLERALREAALEPEFATYIFRFLPAPICLFRVLPSRLRRTDGAKPPEMARDHSAQSGSVRRLLDYLLRPEIRNIERRRPMRFGGSILAVARA